MCYNGMFSSSRNLQMMPEAFRAAGACTSCRWVSHSLIEDIQNKTCLKGTRPLSPLIVPGYLPSVVIGSTSTSFPWTWGMGHSTFQGTLRENNKAEPPKHFMESKYGESNRGAAAGGQEELHRGLLSTSQPPSCLLLWELFSSLMLHPQKPWERREGCKMSRKMPCLLPSIFSPMKFYLYKERGFISVLLCLSP